MTIPPTIREGQYSKIYRAVFDAQIGELLSFGKLSSLDVKTVTANLRNRALRGTYGEGIKIRVRSQIMTNGHGSKSKVLFVEKVLK